MKNAELMNITERARLEELLGKSPESLTPEEKAHIKARSEHLSKAEREEFANCFVKTKEETKKK